MGCSCRGASLCFATKIATFCGKLHIHLHTVHLEDADITEFADFVGVEEFHAACAFVEVVFEGDAAVPVLDGAVACPKGEVDWFGGGEDFAEGGNVDGLHGV